MPITNEMFAEALGIHTILVFKQALIRSTASLMSNRDEIEWSRELILNNHRDRQYGLGHFLLGKAHFEAAEQIINGHFPEFTLPSMDNIY